MTAKSARLDPLAVRRLLRDEGLRARHARSQNFLADPDVLEAILDLADPAPGQHVLEIGPGLGVLTGGLLDADATVVAVELDRGLVGYLRTRFADELDDGRLSLVEGDALDQDLTTLQPPPYDVVANLPYHITSPVLHRLLGGRPQPRRLVLMLQAEVAERIAAEPGRMSYLSVFVQYHARVRVALHVPPGAFEPEPSVASAVVVLEPPGLGAVSRPGDGEPSHERSLEEEDRLWALVQAGFRERRKMIRNVLGRQLTVGQARVDEALAAVGIAGDRRPQTLSVGEWMLLEATLRG